MFRIHPLLVRFLVILAVILLWEILPRSGIIPPLFVPSFSDTVKVAFTDYQLYWTNLKVSLLEMLVALCIAWGGGLVIGAALGSVKLFRRLFLPLVSSLYAVPFVIIYPLLTVWLGIGVTSKVVFAGLYAIFPTLLSTAAGIQTVDEQLILVARSMGATPLQRVIRVIIPAAIPSVLSGIRLGGALVIVGVVVSEMLTSTAGIGYLITYSRTVFDSPRVFFSILIVLAIAVSFDLFFIRTIERRAAFWAIPDQKSRSGATMTG